MACVSASAQLLRLRLRTCHACLVQRAKTFNKAGIQGGSAASPTSPLLLADTSFQLPPPIALPTVPWNQSVPDIWSTTPVGLHSLGKSEWQQARSLSYHRGLRGWGVPADNQLLAKAHRSPVKANISQTSSVFCCCWLILSSKASFSHRIHVCVCVCVSSILLVLSHGSQSCLST